MEHKEENYCIRIALLGKEMLSPQFKMNAVLLLLQMVNCSVKSCVEISQNITALCVAKAVSNIQMWGIIFNNI